MRRDIRTPVGLAAERDLCHDRRVTSDDSAPAPRSAQPAAHDRISRRVREIAPSATLAVDAKAKALKAAGRPVIGFGAGEPDFPTPQHVVDAAIEAAKDPANHHYSPGAGLPELRTAVAESVSATTGLTIESAQTLITNGGKQAVYQAFAAIIDPGDEIQIGRASCRERV